MSFSISSNFSKRAGFTLLELIVVMTIAVIFMTTLVIQQAKWNDRLAVNIQTYELAMMIRQAQVYSLGVREYAGAGSTFETGYGVYVDRDEPDRYVFFADLDKDLMYSTGEDIETKILSRGVVLDRFCAKGPMGVERCSPPLNVANSVHISFLRPDPEAHLVVANSSGNGIPSWDPPFTIYFHSNDGVENSVRVEINGQVSIIQ